MSEFQFLLPDVGEGLTEAEIVSWKVSPGDPALMTVTDDPAEIERIVVDCYHQDCADSGRP